MMSSILELHVDVSSGMSGSCSLTCTCTPSLPGLFIVILAALTSASPPLASHVCKHHRFVCAKTEDQALPTSTSQVPRWGCWENIESLWKQRSQDNFLFFFLRFGVLLGSASFPPFLTTWGHAPCCSLCVWGWLIRGLPRELNGL